MAERPIKALVVTSESDRPESETLMALHRRGIALKVLSSPAGRNFTRMQDAGVPIEPFVVKHRFDRAAVKRLRTELAADDYDILHLFNNKPVTSGVRAARGFDVKLITYRGIVGNVSLYSPVSRMRYLNSRVARVVCVAEAIRQAFLDLRFFGTRLPPERFVTIHKGHDLAWYDAPPVPRSELGLADDAFVIGCAANWRPRKGIEILVDALAQLPRDAGIELLLVGNMNGASLQRRIAESPVRDHIHLAGFRSDAPATIAACDVAVLPSLRREGLPRTVIEAMAYAVPPVVTNVGGSPELVENGKSGLVVPPNNVEALAAALLQLQRDPDKRRAFGAAARERIANAFTIEQTIAATEKLYRELAAERRRLLVDLVTNAG